jgi:hypothetical protein
MTDSASAVIGDEVPAGLVDLPVVSEACGERSRRCDMRTARPSIVRIRIPLIPNVYRALHWSKSREAAGGAPEHPTGDPYGPPWVAEWRAD